MRRTEALIWCVQDQSLPLETIPPCKEQVRANGSLHLRPACSVNFNSTVYAPGCNWELMNMRMSASHAIFMKVFFTTDY